MGAFWRGIPPELLAWGSKQLGENSIAVETGTYLGDGTQLLSEYFSSVVTIERDGVLARNASSRFAESNSIMVLQGSSRDVLVPNIPSEEKGAFFWLDAHFSGGVTAGADDPCPLEFELSAICSVRRAENTIILIDDIRGAIGANGWPSLTELCVIASKHGFKGAIVDDVLALAHPDNFNDIPSIAGRSRTFELAGKSYFWGLINRSLSVANVVVPPLAAVKRRLHL